MGLFHATVLNRRNIRLHVAGVAPFDELDAIWSDHFINLRELRVEHLDPGSAMRLLTRPIPGFNATPEDLAAVDRDVRVEGNAVNHFRNIFDSAPDDARAVLLALSDPDVPTPKISSATRRYLLRRCFITPEGVQRIPVFFDWVQAEHG